MKRQLTVYVKIPGLASKKVTVVFDSDLHRNLDVFINKCKKEAKIRPEFDEFKWQIQSNMGKIVSNRSEFMKSIEDTWIMFPLIPKSNPPSVQGSHYSNRSNRSIKRRARSDPSRLNENGHPNSGKSTTAGAEKSDSMTSSDKYNHSKVRPSLMEKESLAAAAATTEMNGSATAEQLTPNSLRNSRSFTINERLRSKSQTGYGNAAVKPDDTAADNYSNINQYAQQDEKYRNDRTERFHGKSDDRNEGLIRESKWIMPIPDREYVAKRYKFVEILGDGKFAVVAKCISIKDDRECAMKEIAKERIDGKLHYIENEVDLLCRCRHPNIIRLIAAYQTPSAYYMVLELLNFGDLFDAIKQHGYFSEQVTAGAMRDAASALHYLHQYDVVHRDLKPENLLLTAAFRVKLADFGLACRVLGPLYRVCGTPTYVAPEVLNETGYGVEVDMWSLGIICYIMLCGYAPFRHQEGASKSSVYEKLFDVIKAGEYSFESPIWEIISIGAKDLISGLLRLDAHQRLTAAEVLKHRWIRNKADPSLDDNVV